MPDDRHHDVTRLEGFSDAVFGFALTLLVVSLEVPNTVAELMGQIRGFLAFALAHEQLRAAGTRVDAQR